MRVPELLAPAGSREALVAAVQNGADAVYLGGTDFNARRQAPNFSAPELERAIAYAHVRGVKVYVTVNTIVAEEETEEALRFLRFIYESGADAAIVQDIGLLRLSRAAVPELNLHASTQMTLHNSAGAALVRDMGITRIILARELSLKEIETVKRETGLEIEIFVHGALCVCYSGQCLMSSFVGGRSGNRGLCAQPCRLPYVLVDSKGNASSASVNEGEFLLSTRDINCSHYLPVLAGTGVDAFKIEGRLRRPEYVAVVVRVYRKLLDRLAGGNFFVKPEESLALAQVFNRGFSSGYLFGRPGRELMNYQRPNNRGVLLGRVLGYDRSRRLAKLKVVRPLGLGDTIEFWASEGGRVVVQVEQLLVGGRETARVETPAVVEVNASGRIQPADRVFKTEDAALMAEARDSFTGPEMKKIPLLFNVTLQKGEPLVVQVEDPEGNRGEGRTKALAVPAEKQPLTLETLKEQLERLGNTPFYLMTLGGSISKGLFIPKSDVNAARRAAVAELENRRRRVPNKLPKGIFAERLESALGTRPGKKVLRPYLAVSCGDLASVGAALEAGADRVYFGGERFRNQPAQGVEILVEAVQQASASKREIFLLTPRITKDGELRTYIDLINKAAAGATGVVAGNLGLMRELRREIPLPLWADYYLNVFNSQAAAFLKDCGAAGVTLSPELNLARVAAICLRSPLPAEVLVHGLLPLMVSEYCVVAGVLGKPKTGQGCSVNCQGKKYALRDRLGFSFPVYTDTACRMHVFNSRELVMLAHLPALVQAGVAGLRIEARVRDAAYVRRVTRAYRKALDAVLAGAAVDFARLEEELTGGESFTRGHYFREAARRGQVPNFLTSNCFRGVPHAASRTTKG